MKILHRSQKKMKKKKPNNPKIECNFSIHTELLAEVEAIVNSIDPENAGQKHRGKYSKASRSRVLGELVREALDARAGKKLNQSADPAVPRLAA
jgi:hypothetical protein